MSLTVALSKGKLLAGSRDHFRRAGLPFPGGGGRRLVVQEGDLRFLLVKDMDVPTYVDVGYGMLYSGSPYLGVMGEMPVDWTTMNECGEYYVISHVHALHKITSWGAPMTGPITFLRIDPPGGCP